MGKKSIEQLGACVAELALWRQREALARANLDRMRAELEASTNWRHWSAQLVDAKFSLANADRQLRQLAVEIYRGSGENERALHPAVSIRMKTVLEYDPDVARGWCLERLPRALELDRSYFERHARAVASTDPVPCVVIREEPSVAIAADLGAYAPGNSVPDSAD